MKFCYSDESGTSSEPYAVMATIIVDGLLDMCPNDNLGVRYYVAAIYAGRSFKDIDKMWRRANEMQKWDEMEKMVKVQNMKHRFWKGFKQK